MQGRTVGGLLAAAFLTAGVAVYLIFFRDTVEPDRAGFERALNDAGYIMYYPTRADWGPNTVLEAELENKILKNTKLLCQRAYRYPKIVENVKVTLSDYDARTEKEFSIGLELLKAVLGPKMTGKLNLDGKKTSALELKLENSREDSMAEEEKFDEDGNPRELMPQCYSLLKERKDKGTLSQVFIVLRAIKSGVSYDLSKTTEFTGAAEVSVKDVVGVDPNGRWKIISNTEFLVDDDQYVGVATGGIVAINDFLPSGLVSGGYAWLVGDRIVIDSLEFEYEGSVK